MKTTTKAGLGGVVLSIVAAVFTMEGGLSLDRNDRGNWTSGTVGVGELKGTNYGISAMAYPSLDIKNLTKEQATNIYVTDYITKPGYGEIITLSPAVGQKLVDAGVNTGVGRSSRWFQSSLNSLSRGGVDFPLINVDGSIGPASVRTYAALQKKRGKVTACEMVLKLMDAQQGVHYMGLTKYPQYTPGWVDHRIGNVPLSKCKEDG